MRVIRDSSESVACVPFVYVEWRDWKSILKPCFCIPAQFRLRKYHEFVFDHGTPGQVPVRQFSTSTVTERFKLLKSKAVENSLTRHNVTEPCFAYDPDLVDAYFGDGSGALVSANVAVKDDSHRR
eukprot:IDg17415t1